MQSNSNFDLYKIINNSYSILIGTKSNNELSELLGISYSDLNIIFGLWFIYSIHFLLRTGSSKFSNPKLFDEIYLAKKNINLSIEKDFLFKIYYLRCMGVNKDYTLDSIINFVNNHKNINSFNNLKFDNNNNNFEIEEILKKNTRSVIKYLSCSFFSNDYIIKKEESILNLLIKNIPILFNKDCLNKYKNYLYNSKDFTFSKSLYGENIKASVLITMGHKIQAKQHGIQEGLVKYHPSYFYLERSKIDYCPYNNLLKKSKINCTKRFVNWKLIIKHLLEHVNYKYYDFFKNNYDKYKKTIVIYFRGGNPGQIPLNENQMHINLLKDIYYLCSKLSKKYKIILRPRPYTFIYDFAYIDKFDSIENLTIDFKWKYKPKSKDIVLLTYFSSAIIERTIGKGKILFYSPKYFEYSQTNNIGISFLEKLKIDKILFSDPVKLEKILNYYINSKKNIFLNKILLRFRVFKFLIF